MAQKRAGTAARSRRAKGEQMRNFLVIGLILIAIAVAIVLFALTSSASAASADSDLAVVDIPDKTKLVKAELLGKYIFIHDDAKMAAGEACLYVYRYSVDPNGKPEARAENLVLSFHCVPIDRPKASQTVLTYGTTDNGSLELREIQFTGSLKGHRVP